MRTLRSIHNQSELAYISVPITSGKTLYDELLKTTVSEESRNFLTGPASSLVKSMRIPEYNEIIERVISINRRKGLEFLDELKGRLEKPILFPGDLYPRGESWSNDDFQALWMTLIGEKCSEIHMCKGWEYSNGATEEFTHAYQLRLGIPKSLDTSPFFNTKEREKDERERMRNIQVYNHEGKSLSIEEGMTKINKILPLLKENLFNTQSLESSISLLEWTSEMITQGFYQ